MASGTCKVKKKKKTTDQTSSRQTIKDGAVEVNATRYIKETAILFSSAAVMKLLATSGSTEQHASR